MLPSFLSALRKMNLLYLQVNKQHAPYWKQRNWQLQQRRLVIKKGTKYLIIFCNQSMPNNARACSSTTVAGSYFIQLCKRVKHSYISHEILLQLAGKYINNVCCSYLLKFAHICSYLLICMSIAHICSHLLIFAHLNEHLLIFAHICSYLLITSRPGQNLLKQDEQT